ncbi:hypothetical protein [Nocardia sp. NPDC050435]|uniref:hypothetical protein n=1 Tax=Nocardia sp. NPDC050435 TaxID=3155040 RepID=UPI00340924B8
MSEGVFLPTPSAPPTAAPVGTSTRAPGRQMPPPGSENSTEPRLFVLNELSTLVAKKVLQSRRSPRLPGGVS